MNLIYTIGGILIPFMGTTFGSGFVFFLRNMNQFIRKIIVGFAAGVMIAASVWSLIIPAVEMTICKIVWLPVSIGFSLGILFLLLINRIASDYANKKNKEKLNMLMFSVTLHNIPEGMAVGICFVGYLSRVAGITLTEALVLAIGIGIQNIPEGAIISLPLKLKGVNKHRAFLWGLLSGIVEPIAALLTIILVNVIKPLLPYLLAFAAGAMIYVVVEELIPEMHDGKKSSIGIIGLMLGFILMMVLDISLG